MLVAVGFAWAAVGGINGPAGRLRVKRRQLREGE
jgi:hypothetical protein